MGVSPGKPLDSSVAAKTGWAQWPRIRAGLFAQHLFFVPLQSPRSVSEWGIWLAEAFWGAAQLKSMVAHAYSNTHTHTLSLSLSLSHTRQCLFTLSGLVMTFCCCLWFVFVSSHYSLDLESGLPPWLYVLISVQAHTSNSCNTFHIRPYHILLHNIWRSAIGPTFSHDLCSFVARPYS